MKGIWCRLAERKYRRLARLTAPDGGARGDERFERWRELRLEEAVRVNPLAAVGQRPPYPADLDSEWYPEGRRSITIDGEAVELDDVIERADDMAARAWTAVDEYAAGGEQGKRDWARMYMVQAGWRYYDAGRYELALRYFVNYLRLQSSDGFDRGIRGNWARCLQELGDLGNAAVGYLHAAEEAVERGEHDRAADLYERAGLAWEAVPGDRPEMTLVYEQTNHYDSTACFRRAKSLYAAIGEYDAASRCAVLERETQRRWGSPGTRRALLLSRSAWLYGESPGCVVWWVFVSILVFAALYLVGGFQSNGQEVRYTLNLENPAGPRQLLADFATSAYFSAITLATVGYGDFTPCPGLSRLLAAAEGLLGILLMAMLVATVQRRYGGR